MGRSSVSGVPSTSSIVARIGGRSLYAEISSTLGTNPVGPELRMPSNRRSEYRAWLPMAPDPVRCSKMKLSR